MTQPDKLAQAVAESRKLTPAAPTTEDEARFASLPLPQQIAEQTLEAKYPDQVRGYHTAEGAFVDLPPDAAEEAFRKGNLRFDRDQEMHVQLADGRTGTVSASELGETLDQGGSLISARQARDAQLARSYGGVAGALGAGALGAGTGLTGGITDELVGFGGAEASEAARFMKERHPLASGIGQAGGMIAGALLAPGSGLGEAAEQGAARIAGTGATSFAGRVAQRAAAMGARGAAEGIQMAHAEAVSEEALGAPPLTAEKYWASLGEQALFGAGLGAGGALVGEVLGAGKRAIADRLARRAEERAATASAEDVEALAAKSFGYVPKGLGEAYVRASSALAGGGEDIIREAGVQNQSAAAKAIRKDLLHVDEVRSAASREIREHVDTMLKGTDALTDEAKGGLKREYIRGAVERGNEEAVARHSADTIASARAEIGGMLADAETFGQERLLARVDSELARYEKQIAAAAKAGDNAEQFALLDDAKRAVGRWTRATKATSIRSAAEPITLRQALATHEKLDGLYEGLRANLENEGVWGKAAADQRAINAAWSEQIAADKQFRGALATVVGEERFGGKIYGADPQKIAAYVAGLTNPEKDLVHQAVGRYTKSTKELARAVGDRYDLPAGKVAQVRAVVGAAEATDKTLAKAGERLAYANQLKALVDKESHGAAAVVHGLAGAALLEGHTFGAIAGMALGAMTSAVTKPGHSILRLAQLESQMARVDRAIGGSVTRFLERGAEGAARPLHAVRRYRQADRAREATLAASEVRQEYARRAAAVRQWQENPDVLRARVGEHVDDLHAHAPAVARELTAVAGRAAAFLASKLPSPPKADTLLGTEGVPSASEQSRFLRYVRAVERPQSVAEDLAHGRVSYEGVEALRAVYPNLYDEMRGGVMRALADHTGRITYQQRVQLGVLFDVAAAPSLSPESVKVAQATYATPPAKSPGPGKAAGKPLPQAKSAKTPEQQLEQGSP